MGPPSATCSRSRKNGGHHPLQYVALHKPLSFSRTPGDLIVRNSPSGSLAVHPLSLSLIHRTFSAIFTMGSLFSAYKVFENRFSNQYLNDSRMAIRSSVAANTHLSCLTKLFVNFVRIS